MLFSSLTAGQDRSPAFAVIHEHGIVGAEGLLAMGTTASRAREPTPLQANRPCGVPAAVSDGRRYTQRMRPSGAAGWAGLAGVVLNALAVAALRPVPHTYAPGDVGAWLAETRAAPLNTQVSAWAFTVGLVALAAFAAGLASVVEKRRTLAVVGAVFFGAGALLDATGTLAPIAALHVDDASGVALLWLSLLLDSAFNGLLGVGLLCFAGALRSDEDWPKALRWLGVAAGLASLPVALQFSSDAFARLLAVAGPLWLAWVSWTSVLLLRRARDAR